jgi:hypothetical protein
VPLLSPASGRSTSGALVCSDCGAVVSVGVDDPVVPPSATAAARNPVGTPSEAVGSKGTQPMPGNSTSGQECRRSLVTEYTDASPCFSCVSDPGR